MANEKYWRQLGWYDPMQDDRDIAVVGVGSIGSYTIFQLLRMGVKPNRLSIIDPDKIDDHNFPNQFFSEVVCNVGDYKTSAMIATLATLLKDVDGIKQYPDKVENVEGLFPDVMIVAVDNMKTRKYIYDNIVPLMRKARKDPYIIDVRVGGLEASVYCIKCNNEDERYFYERYLHTDGEIKELPCTERSVVDTSFAFSAEIVTHYRQICSDTRVDVQTYCDKKVNSASPFVTIKSLTDEEEVTEEEEYDEDERQEDERP